MKKIRFSTRISIYIIVLVSTLFSLIFAYNYHKVYHSIYNLSIQNARTLSMENVEKIERILQTVEQVPDYIAWRCGSQELSENIILDILYGVVSTNDEIYGSTIAVSPGALSDIEAGAPKYYAPYFYHQNEGLGYADLAASSYRYWEQDWFTNPQKERKAVWNEPYFDEGGGNVFMATYSVPIYHKNHDGDKIFFGVITADISLEWLQDIVDNLPIYETGTLSLISRTGHLIAYPHKKNKFEELDTTIFELAEEIDRPELQELAEKITSGKSDIISFKSLYTEVDSIVLYTPLPSTGWSVVVSIPKNELFAELMEQSIVIFILGTVGIIGIVLLVSFITYKATSPLRKLSESTKEIAQGNLDVVLPEVKHLDEIGELTLSFENMKTALKEYIANLTEATARQERIESELKIATHIQTSFLPHESISNEQLETVASLTPAREVGGDLYDYFFLDDKHLFFSIGDVSGKGVPAALFMAVTQSLVKSIAKQERNPAIILHQVNNSLAKENDACMFVTLFCGILNIQTGELIYSNAGHENPVLISQKENIQNVQLPQGMALGVMENMQYQNKSISLNTHDVLLLYTDGVTDALSIQQENFGKKNLYKVLEIEKNKSLCDIVNNLKASISEHEAGCEQFDDITLIALKRL